jgi:hypothetical protein
VERFGTLRADPALSDTRTSPVRTPQGDGGNREGLYTKWLAQPAWSAFRLAEYGSGALKVLNATHAAWALMRNADPVGKIYDETVFVNTWTA